MRSRRQVIFGIIIFGSLIVSAIDSINFGNYTRNVIFAMLLFVIALFSYMILAYGLYALRAAQYLKHPRVIKFEDVSAQNIALSSAAERKFAGQLQGLGFSRLGELKVITEQFPSAINFHFHNEDARVSASINGVGRNAYVRFYSRFADEAVMETYYPLGFDVETPSLRARIIKGSLEQALSYHEHQLEAFQQIHGAVTPLPDMQSLLDNSQTHVMEFTMIRLRHITKRYLRTIIVLTMVVIILLPSWLHLYGQTYLDTFTLLGMIAATLVALLMMRWLKSMEDDLYADKRKQMTD